MSYPQAKTVIPTGSSGQSACFVHGTDDCVVQDVHGKKKDREGAQGWKGGTFGSLRGAGRAGVLSSSCSPLPHVLPL